MVYHIVTNGEGTILGVYGSALLSEAQGLARRIEYETGFYVHIRQIVSNTRPRVGQSVSMKGQWTNRSKGELVMAKAKKATAKKAKKAKKAAVPDYRGYPGPGPGYMGATGPKILVRNVAPPASERPNEFLYVTKQGHLASAVRNTKGGKKGRKVVRCRTRKSK